MANRFSYQVLKDDTQTAVIKLTGAFDGSGQESTSASPENGVPLLFLQGNGEYDGAGNWITIKNPTVTANNNGDIAIVTKGQVSNATYTIILELRKDNAHYQRGQFNDPAAFNYGAYSLKP